MSMSKSHPAWGAWIEICPPRLLPSSATCRTPHGVRGLKYRGNAVKYIARAVAPRMGCVD